MNIRGEFIALYPSVNAEGSSVSNAKSFLHSMQVTVTFAIVPPHNFGMNTAKEAVRLVK